MNDILKEALKDIPTIKSDLSISAYGSIDLDELNKTVERLNKIPNYDDLMKENNQLQSNWNSLREWLKNKIDNFQDDVSEPILHEQMTMRVIYEYMENLDKMNELEGDVKE